LIVHLLAQHSVFFQFMVIKNFNIKYLLIFYLATIFIVTACNPEKKLAWQFIRNHKGNSLLIVPSYELGKDNLVISYDTNYSYSSVQFDSIAWEQSCYIKHISDSVFLTSFTNSLINELNSTGFNVLISNYPDDFQDLKEPKMLVQVAQLQINETHSISEFEVYQEKIEGYVYSIASLRLNTINLQSWFVAGKSDSGARQHLYCSESITDRRKIGFDFVLNKGNEGLQQNRDSLVMEDVYNLAENSGRKHAEMIFDLVMNEYISNYLADGTRKKYYHFDRESHSLIPALDEWVEE
jgi:hypothetical protein